MLHLCKNQWSQTWYVIYEWASEILKLWLRGRFSGSNTLIAAFGLDTVWWWQPYHSLLNELSVRMMSEVTVFTPESLWTAREQDRTCSAQHFRGQSAFKVCLKNTNNLQPDALNSIIKHLTIKLNILMFTFKFAFKGFA